MIINYLIIYKYSTEVGTDFVQTRVPIVLSVQTLP